MAEAKRCEYDTIMIEPHSRMYEPEDRGCRGFMGRSVWIECKVLGIKSNKQSAKRVNKGVNEHQNCILLKQIYVNWMQSILSLHILEYRNYLHKWGNVQDPRN